VARPVRYTFILALVALATGLAAAGGWHYARASAPVNGPIILISIDTLRADHLPAYGYTKVKTPALDALAADGTVFERAYSHAPQTLVAHASLLSGRLPFETGVRDDIGFVLKDGERLLPQMLRERGYATAAVVSAYVLRRETGIGQGFDFFDGVRTDTVEPAAAPVWRDGAESEIIAERWLDQQDSPRVFLFLHLFEPHQPYDPPPQFADYEPYDGEIAYVDAIVGRLIQYLKSHQLYDQSTIVLLSDHGEGLGDHEEQGHGLFLYDEVLHVPLIVKQAAGAGAGSRVREVVQHVDLVPTILDLANAPTPGHLRGRSLKRLLDGSGRPTEQPVYSEALYAHYHFGWTPVTALTDGHYRYINAPRVELYDLERDPHEQDNAAGELDQVQRDLAASLDRLTAGAATQAPRQASGTELERFRALGYVWAYVAPGGPIEPEPIDPKDRVALLEAYRHAGRQAAQGRPAAAIDSLQRIATGHPLMAEAWQQLGNLLVLAGRPEPAVRAYRRSAAVAPLDPRPLLAAATSSFRLGRLDDARRDAETVLELASSAEPQLEARIILARVALARRDADTARAHAAQGQEADPSAPLVPYVEGLLAYDQGRYEDALRHLKEAAVMSTERPFLLPELHFYTAEALGRLERWDESIAELVQELDGFPHNHRARASLATVYQTLGRADDAARTLDDLVKIAPTPEAYGLAARQWTTFGDARRAETLRTEARRRFRTDAQQEAKSSN
jgi:arylsulfatase A-like enzyme/Flp pilus assembly protein TadD